MARKIISIVQRIGGKQLLRNTISDGFHADVFGEIFEFFEGDLRSSGSAKHRHSQDGNL